MNMQPISRERLVTADRLQHLPEPVQRYMSYTGVVGQPWIDTVHLTYTGKFRLGADKSWMPMTAEQFYTTNPPGFLWKAHFKLAGLPLMYGQDTYKNGHGHMFGKLAGLITIFDARGDEMDQGTMLRYLQEMTWFPIAMLGDNIRWQAVDDHSTDITFHDADKSVTARMYFDEAGRLTNFVAQRYRENNGQYSLDTWAAPVTAYGMRAGLNLPIGGYGVWKLPAGDLPYIELEMSEIAYNCPLESF
ncbi:MAG: hypothetical protein IT324_33935 [Anaerolineae bacterium]|nr:hypothetical protein [Anaerolineae bacterium]